MARLDEVRTVAEMAKGFESETAHVKVDVDHCTKTYTRLLQKGIGGILVLRDGHGAIRGGLGYIVAEDLHAPIKMAIETFWFVPPTCRGEGVTIVVAFEEMARINGCGKAAMIHMEDSHPEELELLYRRRKYKLIERHFVKEIEPCQ